MSTLRYVASPIIHGSVAAEFTPTASSRVYVAWDATGQNDIYGRLYLRLTALPVSGSPLALLRVVDAAGLTLAGVNVAATGVLQPYQGNGSVGGSALTAGTVPIVTGSPVRVEWHMVLGSVTGLVETRLFLSAESTTPDGSLSLAANTSGTPAQYRTGYCLARTNPTATFHIDDLTWGQTDWPGPTGTPPAPPPAPPPPDVSLTYPGAPVNWINEGSTTGTVAGFSTRASSIMGAGFQNTGCMAPAGVGHQWYAASGGDVCGPSVLASAAADWVLSDEGLPESGFKSAGIEGSATVANRLWYYSSSAANLGRLYRGTYSPSGRTVKWVLWASVTGDGPDAGGSVHPRQVGRLLTLDEAGGYAYLGGINGVYRVNLSTQAATRLGVLTGAAVTGLALDATDRTILYATVDTPAGSAGVWRLTGIRGTATAVRYSVLTNPQDLCLNGDGSRLYVAAMDQGVRRWTVGTDITTGWADRTGNLNLGGNGIGAVDASGTGTSTRLLVSTAGTASSTNAGGVSVDEGATWANEAGGWTVTDTPWNDTAQWWLTANSSFYRLDDNGWDSAAVRFDPANPNIAHLHGRSGVWRTVTLASTPPVFRPLVRGLAATVSWGVGVDPRSGQANGMAIDGDWGPIRSNGDKFTSMPTRVEPGGNPGTGMGVMYRADNGRAAVALGDWSSSTNGEVYTNSTPHSGAAWTDEGFSAVPSDTNRCGAAIGVNAAGAEVLLTLRDGGGIQRKVSGAISTVETGVTNGFYSLAKFCWPNGHLTTQNVVYLSASNGLWRSSDAGATWTKLFTYTNTSEYTGEVCALPSSVATLFLTTSSGPSGAGLYKVTGATGASPTMTRIGPTVTAPGPCAIDADGYVYFAVTQNQAGGAKIYKSADPNPGAATTFTDLTDDIWRGGATFPSGMAAWADGTLLVSNKQGGYFVGEQTLGGTGYSGCCNSSSVNTAGGVVHDYGGNAGCNTVGGSPFTPPGTYSQWGLAGTWKRMEWKLRVDDDDPNEGHFWAMQTKFQASPEQFYFGLQRNGIPPTGPPTKLALFSVWGATGAVAGDTPGASGQPFVEFGAGYSVLAPYPWTLGLVYTLRVQADTTRGVDWWRFEVVADATGVVSWIGSVQVPGSWGDLEPAAVLAFTEWFTNEGGLTSCLQIPRVTAFLGTPGFSTVTVTGGGGTGGGGGGTATGVAQPLLLGLHRPLPTLAQPTTPPTVDASSPAVVRSGNTNSVRTTASFTPPSGTLLLAVVANNTQAGVVRDHTLTDSQGGIWTQRAFQNDLGGTDGPGGRGQVAVWTRNTAGAGTAMTVTDTIDANEGGMLKVLVLTGGNVANPVGDVGSASGTATAAGLTLTTQSDQSLVVGAVEEWNLTAVGTAGAGCTVSDGAVGPNITSYLLRRDAATATAGTVAPLTTSAPTTGTEWNAVAVEVRGT